MTISVWRYSHLALAVSFFLFIALASITGIILAFQPLADKMPAYRAHDFNQITLSQAIPSLKAAYPDITDLSIDANQFLIAKGNDADGNKLLAYVDPRTGKVLGHPGNPNEFFQWVTALHRSLFLHEAGRIFMGITAFILLLIAISGTVLVIQRQRGVRHFFKKIVKENFAQYYHVVLGRLSLIPILIIALTGTFLSLTKFAIFTQPKKSAHVDLNAIKDGPKKKLSEFAIFKETKLADVQSIEYPFSDDPEDYYTIKLKDRELAINQITGDILSDVPYPTTVILNNLSLDLHTGRASAIWAIVLAVASANILFFIYSGFMITLKRRSNRVKNKYKAEESKFILLVGSENGNTFRFAGAIHQQLIKNGQTAFLAQLNDYKVYPQAKHIIVFTATYGLGDAPTNAKNFEKLLDQYQQLHPVQTSVVAFGSHAYPDFCQFGFEVNNLLSRQHWAVPLLEIHTVNDKSPAEFGQWATTWAQMANMDIEIAPELLNAKPTGLQSLTVIEKTPVTHDEGAFLIRLKTPRRSKFTSGDLLAIYPANDHRERLYSIGKVGNDIQLSVKLHRDGLGSGYLHQLQPGQSFKARIAANPHFYFPQNAPAVVLISNGTGIAPFLGMLDQNTKKISTHLYCGFRGQASFDLYESAIKSNLSGGQLNALHVAFSREGKKQYIKDLLAHDAEIVAGVLAKKGAIMLCGSLSMQNDMIELLDHICQSKLGESISHYQSHGQILMDCY
ncbi:PepSY domain-containing protein [Mucilaginibacter glaciei]|uniref:NADPH--hemoprotein reductase n=1 Tax=Mucilaginibacter glaciei TaxID=2772109 RepID=A0A926RZ74_9SPHI|nr:PepSY domain-containing protein [Mucilaginibacter glaciei]MBD1391570.1 PepSY domain-containing protein [Mucilaginibacter glaciei]